MKTFRPVRHLCLLWDIAPLALVSAQERSVVVPGSVLQRIIGIQGLGGQQIPAKGS